MGLEPQHASRSCGINPALLPPRDFIATVMDLTMVSAAERNGELITDLAAERRCLGKAQMMGIGGAAAADEARLLGYRLDVVTVTDPPGRR